MTTQIVEYSKTESGLQELRSRLANVVYDLAKPPEMERARKDRRECVTLRTSLEALRVQLKADVLQRGRLIDGEARRITTELTAIESPIDLQIKTEEQRKEVERHAKIEAERNRVADIRERIDAIKRRASAAIGMTADQVASEIAAFLCDDPSVIDAEYAEADESERIGFAEFRHEAIAAHGATIDFLRDLHEKKVAAEAEAAQLKAAREQFERLKVEQARRDHEAKIAREAQERADKDRRDEEVRVARVAQEARDRTAREQREREDAIRRQQIEAEEKHHADARAELAAEQRRQDAERQRIKDDDARITAAREIDEARRQADEQQRQAAEIERAEIAKMLKQAKRPTAMTALLWIAEIASDDALTDAAARKQIQIVAIANTPKAVPKATEAEQAELRA